MSSREQQADETRTRIAKAALELFAQRGFDGTSTREVARAAGVSNGLVFNYFPTKADLLVAAAGQRSPFMEQLDTLLEDVADDPLDRSLHGVIDAFLGWLRAERNLVRITISQTASHARLRDAFEDSVTAAGDRIGATLLDRAKGEGAGVTLDASSIGYGMLGPCVLFFLAHGEQPDQAWERGSRRLTDTLVAAYVAVLGDQG